MKKFIGLNCICLLFTAFITPAFSQADVTADYESYLKSNIAVSNFKVLGVNRKQYARCLETENFLEPEKVVRFLAIDKVNYADDGNGYDLKAGDGVLTSTELFAYTNNNNIVSPGIYQEGTAYNTVLTDPQFEHNAEAGRSSSIGVKCKVKWVPCNQMTNPAQQWLCNWAGWPYGELVFYDCEVSWSAL